MPESNPTQPTDTPFGLAYWMERVLDEVEGARRELSVDRVHDLRVALRRCRSMAEGFMAIDPNVTWNSLQKESRQLFRRLGRLRDVQVLEQWINRLGEPDAAVSVAMLLHLGQSEQELRHSAVAALQSFNHDKWRDWIDRLQARARCFPEGGAIFQLRALQAWNEAHALHKQALRNRSAAAYHSLRIGIKRFRYTVENFLPLLHGEWGPDLKEIQDCLGEVHDLSVFWQTALRLRAFPDLESRERWRALIAEQTAKRLDRYREKMVGSRSLWINWRQGLPPEHRLPSMSLSMIEKWASLHGIDLVRARHVRHLALQLFNGLRHREHLDVKSRRAILHFAAVLHELGRAKNGKGASKLLLELPSAPGFTAEEVQRAVFVIRGHRGKGWEFARKELAALSEDQRWLVTELCGILRLARILAVSREPEINSLKVEQNGSSIVILVPGYSEVGPLAEKVARARYLLESASHLPVIFRNDTANRLKEEELAQRPTSKGSSAQAASETSVDPEHDTISTPFSEEDRRDNRASHLSLARLNLAR